MARKKIVDTLAEIDERIDLNELLTASEKDALEAKAREAVHKKRKEKAEDEYLQALIKAEERRLTPSEVLEDVYINLPKHAAMIRLDSVVYFHGLIYEVPYSVARVMADVMARAWEHQSEIEGYPRRGDLARQPHNAILRPGMEGMQASRINTLQSMRS